MQSDHITRPEEPEYQPACGCQASTVLLRVDCGAGGTQYRNYCTACWRAGRAIPHRAVRDPDSITRADLDLIEKARVCAARRAWAR